MATLSLNFGTPTPPQEEFLRATERFVLYGGARGGGKSWIVRFKAAVMGLGHPGIKQMIIRKSYPELRENHILPMIQMLGGAATYKEADHSLTLCTGSRILYRYVDNDGDLQRLQGMETDLLYIDEITQLTEYQFSALTAIVRGTGPYPRRTYCTGNPGGVGHAFVRRLWVDRLYRGDEDPDDYRFIPARVTDNPYLMANDPGYVKMLRNLPPGLREMWLNGSWDITAGSVFSEFDRSVHVIAPFIPPEHWRRYVALDYGMDMLAAYLIAVDEHDNAYVMRERYQGRDLAPGAEGLIASEAARTVREMVGDDKVDLYLAPPDLWQRKPETGRSVADIFLEQGVSLTRVSNDRIQGWAAIHERLKVEHDEQGQPSARLRIFRGCDNLIRTLPLLQYDEHKPNDAAIEPHEITHAPDALRYFCVYWTGIARQAQRTAEWTPAMWEDYRNADADSKRYLIDKWGHPVRRHR